jgi:hypothetical protein
LVHSPEPKLVHHIFLFIVQFPWPAAFDSEDAPSGTMRHGAFCCVNERLVCVQAVTVTPAVRPRRFVVGVDVPKARKQQG